MPGLVVCFSIPWQSGAAIATAMACRRHRSSSTSRRRSSSTAAAFFFFFFFFLANLLMAAVAAAIDDDAAALLAFKAALNRADRLSSWANTSDVCISWHGVNCSGGAAEGQRVTELRLPGLALHGSIAAGTLGKLNAVKILSLRNNFLFGNLPSDLANCTSLRQVVITHNDFSGDLPSDGMLGAWQLLQTLDVANNSFSGTIPASIDGLPKLRRLYLQHNLLNGSIPPLATIAPLLKNFSVADNRLSGSIPYSLQNFSADSFTGNADLCGPPLQTPCPSPPPSPSSAPSLSPSPAPSRSPSPSSGGLGAGSIAAIVVCSVAFAAVLLAACLFFCWRRRQRQRAPPAVAKKEDLFAEGREEFHRRMMRRNSSRGATLGAPLPRTKTADRVKQSFDLNDLLRASAEILGKGSLGTVYKVEMENGMMLCVKRLRRRNGPTAAAEAAAVAAESEETALGRRILENLCSLSHPNLVPVRAHFVDQNEKLLITDYIPHHSLSTLLHGSKGRKTAPPLEWRRRLAVATGAAKGLVFLHSRKVVHGSIKSTNLLLMGGSSSDGDAAMWSDYGLLPVAAGGVSANGYTPPEAILDPAKINYKGDVYSFGILLLEILTAKLPAALLQKGGILLPQWVQSQANVEDALDRNLTKRRRQDEDEVEEMLCLLRIAMSCVAASPDRRPHMVEIVKQIVDLQNRATGVLSEFL